MAVDSLVNEHPVLHGSTGSKARSEPPTASDPIAIVGMACRFAGDVDSPSKLWKLCVEGRDVWSPIPLQRFDMKSWYDKDSEKRGTSNVLGGYFMDQDLSLFDAAFFNLPGDMASAMDPQMRLLLESTYEAIEDAGIPVEKLAGSNASVYTAIFTKDYHEMQTKDTECLPRNFTGGVGAATLSNRISHFFDVQGPSMTIDTGCSGSMVSLHQACQSLRSGESSISIVGGVNAMLHQDPFIYIGALGTLGSNGRCYAWDSRAEGYGRGEGVATLVLKPLAAALESGDRIHAVIKESGVNQDGKTQTLWSPSTEAQVKLIEDCYRRAGLDISETGYVEAHMTGTRAGDPIEAEALARTFGASRNSSDPVLVGSVKTNVGHTEAASGLAGVIKTVFALQEGLIPPNLNYETTNPAIPLDEWHLQVPVTVTKWPKDRLLRASINNFGYGGTNAHLIVERTPRTHHKIHTNGNDINSKTERSQVYLLSAKDSGAVKAMASQFAAYIRQSVSSGQSLSLNDLAYTLAERRSLFPWRVAVRASNVDELCGRLESSATQALHATKLPRLGFVFNGQGAQWHAMARELITAYSVFGRGIRKAEKILMDYGATWSLSDELMRDEYSTRVSEVHLSQPVTVAIQLCLVDLLESWGITPSAVTSHSSGEIAAAYAVKALSFKEALGAAYFRGELALKHLKLTPRHGGMLAVGLGPEDVEQYVVNTTGHVVVACINSPKSVTLSGDQEALDEVATRLTKSDVFNRKLQVPMAYHSHHMLDMVEDYTNRLQEFLPDKKTWNGVLFSSPTTGEVVTSAQALSPSHWARNLSSPVQFSRALENMCFGSTGAYVDMIVEIGAHGTLAGPIRQILKSRSAEMPYVSCLTRNTDSVSTMQDVVCELVARGYPVSLTSVNTAGSSTTEAKEKPAFVANLPSYPWNHTTHYWTEPRVAKELKHKKFPPQELLGSPLAGASGSNPTWRNFLRTSDVDWLVDHQVGSKVVLPGAAYIAMAVEAVRLLTDASEKTIRGYRLRNIDILNTLVIPETSEGVETQLCLHQCSEKDLEREGWYQFEFSSLGAGDEWVENCKGFVSAETSEQKKTATTYEPKLPSQESYLDNTNNTKSSSIDVATVFSSMREMGIKHGPAFQNLIESRSAGDKAITELAIARSDDYVVHPTTLDSIFQATYNNLPKDMMENSTFLPRSIRAMFISRNLSRQRGDRLQTFTELLKADKRGCTLEIMTLNQDDSNGPPSIFYTKDFFVQAVPRDSEDGSFEATSLCSKVRWEQDILHDVPSAVKNAMTIHVDNDQAQLERDCVRVSYHFIEDAVLELEGQNPEAWQPHHQMLYIWMKSVVENGRRGELASGSKMWSRATQGMKQMLFDEVSAADGACQLLVRVGQHLAAIIRGEIEPLELMMEGDLLSRYYIDFGVSKRCYKHLVKIIELFSVKTPAANVLEIGAGTGGATKPALEAFGARAKEDGLPGFLLGRYTFTDISTGFFSAARQKLAAWEDIVDFQALDIEEDPVAQSFTAGSYDLVIASMVLHATKNLKKTLSNVRKLLKPSGKLLLVETTRDRLDMQLIFGTLPGWWLGADDGRQMSPNVSSQVWDKNLREAGFGGLDFEMRDSESELYMCTVMLSTAVATNTVLGPISIVHNATDTKPTAWLAHLCDQIKEKTGTIPSIESLDQTLDDQAGDKICIFTAEMERPFVSDMSERDFDRLRKLLLDTRDVFWLSCGGLVDAEEPSFAATLGLLRTLRAEDTTKRYIHLDFEPKALHGENICTSDKLGHIIHVLQRSFAENTDINTLEREYAVKDSILHVARAYPDKAQGQICNGRLDEPTPELQPFHQPGRHVTWDISRSGLLSDLRFAGSKYIPDELPSGYVEVESKAYGLNFRDVMEALGLLDAPLVAHETAGIITRVGSDTKGGLQVGDRVCGMAQGRWANRSQAHSMCLAKIPDNMPFEYAASIPTIFTTAYYSLFPIARLQSGESVLIHAATGGVGQAAIVLAQQAGAEIFATCSTEAKRDFLVQYYHINPDHILSSRDESFAPAIMEMTNGKGVDVVLNSLSGALLKATWDCIARFGRFVEIGKIDMEAGRNLDMTPFRRCATYSGVDVLQLGEYNRPAMQQALAESIRICHERRTTPVSPITTYSISDVEKAMRHMQSGVHMGKLVLVPGDQDVVNVISRPPPISLDDEDASYLIIGGLGGIGRAIAAWMVEKGARHLILVSRRATSHPAASELRAKGKRSRCNVQIRDCDVAIESSLVDCINDCRRTMPAIRGLVNGAMVLDDSILESMNFEKWQRAAWPKIKGSRNLHKHLPDLNFCVMLSSLAGVVGSPSQANYGAGGVYLDTLARHRTRNGQPAVVLDLGVVLSAGYVAEREEAGDSSVRTRLEKSGFISVDISQVLRLVEAAIRDPLRKSPDDCQVVVSITERTTAMWAQNGVPQDPRFGTLQLARPRGNGLQGQSSSSSAPSTDTLIASLSRSATTASEATALLVDALVMKLADMFNVPATDIDSSLPMSRYGVDSLVAVELRKWLSSVVRAKVSVFEILQSASFDEFGTLLATRSEYMASKAATAEVGGSA